MKTGFTLAEVLITLTVIGVLAAMTVPGLLNSTNDKELRTAFKKEYSALSNAANQVKNLEAGGTLKGFCDPANIAGGAAPYDKHTFCFIDAFSKYLSVQTACKVGNSPVCWHGANDISTVPNPEAVRRFDGGWSYSNETYARASMILNDGSFVMFSMDSTDCSLNYGSGPKYCYTMQVDVNGHKPPNQSGKDVYFLGLTADGIQPFDVGYSACSKTGNNSQKWGVSCAANALKDEDF